MADQGFPYAISNLAVSINCVAFIHNKGSVHKVSVARVSPCLAPPQWGGNKSLSSHADDVARQRGGALRSLSELRGALTNLEPSREQPSNESSAAPESSLKFLVQLRASCWKSAVRLPISETSLLENGSCLCLGQGAFDVMTGVMITYDKSSISNKIEVTETGPEAPTPSLTHCTVSILMFSWGAFNGSGTNNTLNEKSGIP
ncbi:uncharacterized protein G2W53_004177 [Senna tora]|uniref:Uncharacterized protein n=1 Tax=Senna tora TaxID=362788 RepID=A0A834XCP8_9FABA|nr:uncharacterized protein G2W53_004177 [Senna tora]